MKTKIRTSAIAATGIAILSLAYIAGLHAQQSPLSSATPQLTTNWVGRLVVGKNDTIDAITIGGLHPTISPEVEIGLRSDGVLIWRKASR